MQSSYRRGRLCTLYTPIFETPGRVGFIRCNSFADTLRGLLLKKMNSKNMVFGLRKDVFAHVNPFFFSGFGVLSKISSKSWEF